MRYFLLALFLMYSGLAQAEELRVADKAIYDVRIARTTGELKRGLMFIRKLPRNQGMLFDVQDYEGVKMWMKDTYIPLDMIFIGCDLKITDIYRNAEPMSMKMIGSEQPFCYVLEINAGEADGKDMQIGDAILIGSSS